MNDDTPFLDAELVSAYLDNEATADERARVEGSPALLAQVNNVAEVRSQLQATDAAPADARERAVFAALAAYDEMFAVAALADASHQSDRTAAASPTQAPAPVISLADRRQRVYRRLTTVAAASILLVGGFAALRAASGNDNDSASSAGSAAKTAETVDSASTRATPEGAAADTMAAAETAPPAETFSVEAVGDAPAESMPAEAQETTAAGGVSPFSLVILADAAELAAYASTEDATTDALDPGMVDAVCPGLTPRFQSGTDQLVGIVTFAGEEAFVVRRVDGSVQAISTLSCAILAQVPS
jgi:hypothetical protein